MNQFWLFLKHIGVIDFYWVHNYTKKTIIFTFAHLNCGSQWGQTRLCKLSFYIFSENLVRWLKKIVWQATKDFILLLFCHPGSSHRFSEKIQKLEMFYHHFTWLLYLVICHFGNNCSKRLKISEMTIYIAAIFIFGFLFEVQYWFSLKIEYL